MAWLCHPAAPIPCLLDLRLCPENCARSLCSRSRQDFRGRAVLDDEQNSAYFSAACSALVCVRISVTACLTAYLTSRAKGRNLCGNMGLYSLDTCGDRCTPTAAAYGDSAAKSRRWCTIMKAWRWQYSPWCLYRAQMMPEPQPHHDNNNIAITELVTLVNQQYQRAMTTIMYSVTVLEHF